MAGRVLKLSGRGKAEATVESLTRYPPQGVAVLVAIDVVAAVESLRRYPPKGVVFLVATDVVAGVNVVVGWYGVVVRTGTVCSCPC